MFLFLKKFGLAVANHPVITLVSWLLISITVISVAVVGVFGDTLFNRLTNSIPTVESDSKIGADLLKEEADRKEYSETILLLIEGTDFADSNLTEPFAELSESITDLDGLLISPYGLPKEVVTQDSTLSGFITENGFVSSIVLEADSVEEKRIIVDEAHEALNSFVYKTKTDDIEILFGGETKIVESVTHQAEQDLAKGELISLPISLLALLFIFGGFLAAGMPLLGAGVSIISALGTLFGLSYVMDVDTTVLNVLTVIGLGLSIDYGLLMVSRMREVLRKTDDYSRSGIRVAVSETVGTAGRTVVFSGVTVAVATASLLLFEPVIIKNIAIAASTVVLLAVLASITLLPALFSLLGKKLISPSILNKLPGVGNLLSKFGDVAPSRGVFSKLAGIVQKRPLIYTVISSGILLILSGSILALNISNNGVSILSDKTEQGQLLNVIKSEYPALAAADITVVINSNKEELVKEVENLITTVEDIDSISAIQPVGSIFSFNIAVTDSPQDVVVELRTLLSNEGLEEKVYLTGAAAQDIDYVNSLTGTAPLVALIIIFATGLLLFLMTGSLIVPLKAVVLSVLSLGASVGILVWGFEQGNLSGILGFNPADITAIDPLILVLVLVFGFGLAMDYEMFLISRIKEKHEHGASTLLAVRTGLQASGRIITSAALIIIFVFMGFALGEMLMIKQMGVALAVAVFIDSTLVRLLLMPALISLLGDHIWWAPRWMKKIHEKVGIQH